MTTRANFEVVFPDWYDERGEWEANSKGWLQGVELRFAHGDVHSLFFYDPVRLAQDLEVETKQGRPFIAVPGMVVIPEVTREAILAAVAKLVQMDYLPPHQGTGDAQNDVVHASGVKA
jgi:hypothetical protein